jgi:uncharacterized protein (UPF0261 family)
LDLCTQEVNNDLQGSVVTSGPSRLTAAGAAGVPQIVAPGAVDMVDFPTWAGPATRHADRPYHAHNRLIASITTGAEDRRALARLMGEKLAAAKGPVVAMLPVRGIQQWDQPGEPLHEPEALAAFVDAFRQAMQPPVRLVEVNAHINDRAFADAVLAVLDDWVAKGIVVPGKP